MSLPQGKRAKSRKGDPLSFSAGKTEFNSKALKGGTKQLEATEKPNISKRSLHRDCGGRFFFALATIL